LERKPVIIAVAQTNSNGLRALNARPRSAASLVRETPMSVMILGLVLFLGVHLVPVFTEVRAAAIGALGDKSYRGAFALASLIGFALIIWGYIRAAAYAGDYLFAPFPAAIAIAPYAVTLAIILFAAANMRGHIREKLQHPMLIGLILWSGVHLLANGDRRGTVLFGSFLAYGIVDLVSAIRRRAVKQFVAETRFDVIAIVAGLVVAVAFMLFHRMLFGKPVVGFGL
jgi:uncharacterized membrane protein